MSNNKNVFADPSSSERSTPGIFRTSTSRPLTASSSTFWLRTFLTTWWSRSWSTSPRGPPLRWTWRMTSTWWTTTTREPASSSQQQISECWNAALYIIWSTKFHSMGLEVCITQKCESQELQFWHLLFQHLVKLIFIVYLSTIQLGCEKTSQFLPNTNY